MRILVLDEGFPVPPDSGKRIRSFQIWSRIARHCDVTYLAYGTNQSESARAMREAGMEVVAVDYELPTQRGIAFGLRLFRSLFSKFPLSVDRHFSSTFMSALRTVLAAQTFDLVVCEWTPYTRYTREVAHQRSAFLAVNIEATIWSRFAQQARLGPKRWYLQLQSKRMERFEREAVRTVDGVIAVTELEAEQMRQWSTKTSIVTVDNGVDIAYFAPAPIPDHQNELVFTGSMDWLPNQHAVRHFVDDVLPLVRVSHPDTQFTIVGRNPSKEIIQLGQMDGVEVTGSVPDVRPYLVRATAMVVPLHIGGGSRLKILEALAMARPVVSTSVGAEGLRLVDGEHFLKADDAEAFARQVCRLLDQGELRADLAREGRHLVEQDYGWDQLAEKQYEFMTTLCQRA